MPASGVESSIVLMGHAVQRVNCRGRPRQMQWPDLGRWPAHARRSRYAMSWPTRRWWPSLL